METWESVLVGLLALGLVFFMWPSVKKTQEQAPKATSDDWKGLLIPLAAVVLFVVLLIKLV